MGIWAGYLRPAAWRGVIDELEPQDEAAGQTVGGVIAEVESACAASRQIAAGFALDQTVPHDQLGQVSLRFIDVNIISEHARHGAHADILREQIDGATGD